jgi:hypothetical protein
LKQTTNKSLAFKAVFGLVKGYTMADVHQFSISDVEDLWMKTMIVRYRKTGIMVPVTIAPSKVLYMKESLSIREPVAIVESVCNPQFLPEGCGLPAWISVVSEIVMTVQTCLKQTTVTLTFHEVTHTYLVADENK